MDSILVKIFATAFTLSEVLTHPASVRTHLDPATDQDHVVQVLRAGCDHMRRAFDIETINLDDLISTALDDSAAFGANAKAFHGINFADLNTAYHHFCKNEVVDQPGVDLAQGDRILQQRGRRLAGPDGAQGQKAAEHEHRARRCRPTFRRSVRARQSAHLGAVVRNSGIFAARRRSPPRTAVFSITMASMSVASSAPSSAIWALPAGRKAAPRSPSRW